jgi:hypothetical protein
MAPSTPDDATKAIYSAYPPRASLLLIFLTVCVSFLLLCLDVYMVSRNNVMP